MFLGLGPTQTVVVFYVPNSFFRWHLANWFDLHECAGMRLDDTDIINFKRSCDPFAKFRLEEVLQVYFLRAFGIPFTQSDGLFLHFRRNLI